MLHLNFCTEDNAFALYILYMYSAVMAGLHPQSQRRSSVSLIQRLVLVIWYSSIFLDGTKIRKGHQQLLFLNSPFSVIDNLVGLVGEMPFRTCELQRSFTCVSALISRVLAASSDMILFSCRGENRIEVRLTPWSKGLLTADYDRFLLCKMEPLTSFNNICLLLTH